MSVRLTLRRAARLLILCAALLAALPAARADQARDVAAACALNATEDALHKRYVLEERIKRIWDGGQQGVLEVTLPKEETAQGVMITWYGANCAARVTDEAGLVIGESAGQYRVDWIPFDRPVSRFTIARRDAGAVFRISRLHVLTPGDLPRWVQRWETLEEPAELLLFATHPDDEILWFGGMLPYYAGELRRRVMVVYLVGGRNATRVIELLNGLWSMGVTAYPDIGDLPDGGKATVGSTYLAWGRDTALRRVVSAIRRYRPQVVLTQDVKGEYGHSSHVVMTQAVMDAVDRYAADPDYDPDFGGLSDPPWSPLKLYIHLWKQNVIRFDWQQPLSAFDGRTGLQVARAAFKMHVSQQNGKHAVKDSGRYDCTLFGLYFSAVGPDERGDDLFEHIPDAKP